MLCSMCFSFFLFISCLFCNADTRFVMQFIFAKMRVILIFSCLFHLCATHCLYRVRNDFVLRKCDTTWHEDSDEQNQSKKKTTHKNIVCWWYCFRLFLLIFIFLSFAVAVVVVVIVVVVGAIFGFTRLENSHCINSLLFSRRCILSSSRRSRVNTAQRRSIGRMA